MYLFNHYKVVNKVRFITSIIILSLIFIVLSSIVTQTFISKGLEKQKFLTITVNSGDTLWELGKAYKPESEDVRYFIYQIKKSNDLETNYIYPDQELKIPMN